MYSTGYFYSEGGLTPQLYSICIFIYTEILNCEPYYNVKILKSAPLLIVEILKSGLFYLVKFLNNGFF